MPPMMSCRFFLLTAIFLALPMATGTALSTEAYAQKYPDVVSVKVRARAADIFDFDVTVSSPYDTPQRYADAIRAMSKDGNKVFGVRKLVHDHASEQPFTRDLYDVRIPLNVHTVVIQARDQRYGYGGKTVEIILPGR